MLPPPKRRTSGGPPRGLLLILAVLVGLALLSVAYGILSKGRPDIRLCLPVGLIFTALLASAPLAYAAFQEEMTARQFVTRLGQSRTAWMAVVAFTSVMLLALAGAAAWTATGHTLPPVGTPVAQVSTPVVATATGTATRPSATPSLSAPAATAAAQPTTTPTAASTDAPTTTPSPTAPATATSTSTRESPTITPTTEPTAAPTATPTELPPDPAEQIDQVMVAANDLLVTLIENPAAPREPLQVYFCGENAWRKISTFLARTTARTDRPVSVAYTISDVQPAIQDLDERWVLEQVETWTYMSTGGQQTGSRESYLYYLVATDDPARPFCIDDYSAQAIP